MDIARTLRLDSISTPLLTHLDAREVAIWVTDSFVDEAGVSAVADLLRLPWRLVLNESTNSELLAELGKSEGTDDPLVRRRGFIQLIDTNPADVLLPPRCLPIYLLNGRDARSATAGLAALTRRLTMLDTLRRTPMKELVIAVGKQDALPPELSELWQEGFRTIITVVSNSPETATKLEAWRRGRQFGTSAAYLDIAAIDFCNDLVARYLRGKAGDRVILRVRNFRGRIETLDITGLDDPEHPLLASYELLLADDLSHLQPNDLTTDDLQRFFRDAAGSWRPYAAGVPWSRDEDPWRRLLSRLRRLDREGPEAGRIAFIDAQPGAGGTTLMRQLAWTAAAEGYPTLVAKSAPFVPKALEINAFMTRVLGLQRSSQPESQERLYEVPWLIAFDRMHFIGREEELRRFLREMEQLGRPVCVLVVAGPYLGTEFYDSHFVALSHLTHEISPEAAVVLGKHLNQYLLPHGATRTDADWRAFYEASAVQISRGVAAFWIALSFWLQRQFDMRETIQTWIYRQFKEKVKDKEVYQAILDIAALSTERYPLPVTMLAPTTDWPITEKLDQIRSDVAALTLVRPSREGERYWAMAHDIVGRFLLTALFYDQPAREAAGLGDARDPEHLRFLVLRRLSKLAALGHVANREIAEEFASSIFKIDPGQGHSTFVTFWREVLDALDGMPKTLQASSRSFRHHTAISRRRIAKQNDYFPIASEERVKLLERAVTDIRYALDNIPATPGGETDLNLYNSLAHALHDLADELSVNGAPSERVAMLRTQAHEATQRAYRLDPDNSFVVETYARSLLTDARSFPESAAENSIEILNIVYSAMARDRSGQRRFSLGKLADDAIALLLNMHSQDDQGGEPSSEVDALVQAIRALAAGVLRSEGMELVNFPKSNRARAAELLGGPLLRGNPQAVRMRYALRCLDAPHDFAGQLELLQSLQEGGTVFSPQMRLELAVLLQQCDRHHEAERLFRSLRRLWRESDHYVEVPERLRWLRTRDGQTRQVTARIVGHQEYRRAAKVHDLQDTEVLFRPQEFGQQEFRAGAVIRGVISFGHNGPFLRPTTAIRT